MHISPNDFFFLECALEGMVLFLCNLEVLTKRYLEPLVCEVQSMKICYLMND